MKKYTTPTIALIKLDNEISLVLASTPTPPGGPGEVRNELTSPDHFNKAFFT